MASFMKWEGEGVRRVGREREREKGPSDQLSK